MNKIIGKVIGNPVATPMGVPDNVETTDNKMDFWNENRVSIETYPSSVAVIEIAGKIADDRIEAAIGDVETSLENIIAKYGLGGDA